MLFTIPNRRVLVKLGAITVASILLLAVALPSSRVTLRDLVVKKPDVLTPDTPETPPGPPHPKYKPTPTYLPSPIKDNFPLLASSAPPPIPKWNMPREDIHKSYGLPTAPPLLIGFTRTWPVLQQAVVSYITAGWPASQIYVIENTGVQQANARGQLSLQNPFYLNHTSLSALGVRVITTPTLLNFAQLQNFFLSLTYAHDWPYYFWSHMDVLALSYEDGYKDLTPPYTDPGYKSLYELALTALRDVRQDKPSSDASPDDKNKSKTNTENKWAMRFFAYDHLTLVNPAAYEDVGGWDTLIPYYMTDCDMYTRLAMRGWNVEDAKAGIITDVASALADLSALYRVEGVEPEFVDPNPPPPVAPDPEAGEGAEGGEKKEDHRSGKWWEGKRERRAVEAREPDVNLEKWHALRKTADKMFRGCTPIPSHPRPVGRGHCLQSGTYTDCPQSTNIATASATRGSSASTAAQASPSTTTRPAWPRRSTS
jgi:hypothetical protein